MVNCKARRQDVNVMQYNIYKLGVWAQFLTKLQKVTYATSLRHSALNEPLSTVSDPIN